MECPLGDIDLNRVQTDDGETLVQDHGSTKSQEDELAVVITIDDTNGVQMQQEEETSTQPKQGHEEPEEGEISGENDHGISIADHDDKPELAECNDAAESTKELSHLLPKASAASYDKWSHRSNGHERHGRWKLRSEASTYTTQPDKFYQFAWAQGIQGSSKDSLGDSSQEETMSRKPGDNNRPLNRSSSADRKSGWIVGDRGIEYVKFTRSDDGYLYLHEGGDHSDQRRGDGWKGRSDKGSPERRSMSKLSREVDERSTIHGREYRRRSESRRSSRDSRKRDYRGEVDLEEGEFEGKQAMFAVLNRYSRSRDRNLEKQADKFSLLPCVKEKLGSDSATHYLMSESHKDKLFADIVDCVRNVAVKDAQKSFMNVCRQLRRALRNLRELHRDLSRAPGKHMEAQQRKVSALTRDTFSGIRAAYAVRNTAIGKEQEQDTNAFPRLLELARNRCHMLFTSKQIQELESMMQAIGYCGKTDRLPKSRKRGSEAERGEELDVRIGESSGTTQLESESSTDNSANDRTLDKGDEAEQPLNPSVDLHLGEISMVQPVSILDSSAAGNLGFGGWFSLTPEQGYDDAKAAGPTPAPMMGSIVDLNEDQNKNLSVLVSEMGVESRRDTIGNVTLRDAQGVPTKDHSFTHFDPVRALTSYHEKFAGKSHSAYERLPSPTPSGEEGTGVNSAKEASGVAPRLVFNEGWEAEKEGQVAGLPAGSQPSFFPPESSSHQGPMFPIKENHGRSTPSELTLFPSLDPAIAEDGSTDGLQVKIVQTRGSKKSRDPRRRLVSQPFDLELPQLDNVGNEGLERMKSSQEIAVAQSRELTVSRENLLSRGDLMSLLTLATGGGWLVEQKMGTSSKETPAEMNTADTSSHMIMDSTSDFIDDISQKKRQIDFLSEESTNKKQKIAKEIDDLAQPRVPIDLETSAMGDDSKQGAVSETLSSQGATSLKQPASISELVVNDQSKLRMKPRDPRRALLGSILDKSKTLPVAATRSENTSAASSSGASNLVAQVSRDVSGTTSLPISTHDPMDTTFGVVNVTANAWSNALVKNESLPVIGSSGMPQVSDAISSNSRPDDLLRASKVTGPETKLAAVKPPSKFDLNLITVTSNPKQQSINHWDHLEPLLQGLDERQKQAVRQERARRIEEQSRMFVAKKLCLVLDLDHTLLNSAKFTEIEGEWEAKLQAHELTERNKFSKEGANKRELYRFQHMGMWTKLRPGIWNFLARASNLYELHVYTMGNKAYATEMAKLLDPTGALFAGRVISKGDDGDIVDGDERPPKSKDLDGVLGMESAVVIIDDSARVWPHHRHNLIVVERYMYFPCSRKQFGLPGPSLLEVGHDEREQDGMLASALTVIEKIHYSFFSNPRLHEVDVRDILAKEQRRVLAGCKLVFSRVFPQGEIQPQLHPLWQLAEQFGAVCSIGIDDGVTHVVAISLGTEKVNWALSTGRFVVRPSWLEASAILYRRASERDFSVSP